ncbi:MAG TPA: glycosyltransferase [Roseiarcus sp.]|nr:glycosyltransferase [Roseiarcus sp.]
MKTALCLTPDRAFFRPAICTAATILAQDDADRFDVFVVCESEDVATGVDRLAPDLRRRIKILCADFSAFDRGLRAEGRFSRAVFRRLFLDRVLPADYERIVSIDSDVWVARPGLGRLAALDFGGAPFAAAYDMIFLMDFARNTLAKQFQADRAALGLAPTTPYFNAGVIAIDRRKWSAMALGERVVAALRRAPERYPFLEQSALNEIIAGGFAPLSPRYNFMGDFFLLDLEEAFQPIALHFVNAPKPWQYELWRGERRFAENYRAWFAASPWPELAEDGGRLAAAPARKPRLTPQRRAFAERLTAYLRTRAFIDGWRAP